MSTSTAHPRRRLQPLLPAVVLLAAIGLASASAAGVAQAGVAQTGVAQAGDAQVGRSDDGPAPAAFRDAGAGADLPVTAVNLFTSGVGYFQHDGVVDGDAEISLTVSTSDVNDLLKSLVLQDFDGGSVEAVTYPSQDPLARILGSFSLDIADNPSLAELINRARGAAVNVEGAVSAAGTVSGVEYQSRTTDGVTERVAILNLLTSDGLRQLAFASMRSIRFTDPALQRELEAALQVIAENRRQDRRSVTIRFSGTGVRRVRVGYIRAVPVWKTSYRVVLGDDGTAQIQGWAIVENTGEVDWTDVALGLVSRQPISFVMDLYTPVYTTRPRVAPDVATAVAPQQYDRDVPMPAAPSRSAPRAAESMAESGAFLDRSPAAPREPEPIDLGQGVRSAAALESGAVYRIAHPVSIPRRGAALIPIVAARIPAERISIYDPAVLAGRPLSAVRLTNATDLLLPAGPATVFDGASYAGDARLPVMIAGEDRLVSFAVDLETTALLRPSSVPQEITRITIAGGVLTIALRDRRETGYVFERLGDADARYIVVHPKTSDWEVVGDARPVGETASTLRFETQVAAGETSTLLIVEERVRSQTIALTAIRDDQIAFYLSQRAIDAQTARSLERIRTLRSALADRETERRTIEQEINGIHREQERVRANLTVLEKDSDLYRRYLQTLTSQEDRLDALQADLRRAREREAQARDALSRFIESLV